MGHHGDRAGSRARQGRAPPLRGRRLRRDLRRTRGVCRRRCARAAAALGSARARSTGWTSRGTASGWLARRPRRAGAATRSRWRSASTATSTRPTGSETIRLLARAFEDDPPDVILLETLSLVRSSTYATVERLLDDRPAAVAQLPPLPTRCLRRLRRALGRPGGRRLRSRRAALRGDGRRRAAGQLHTAGPRAGDGLLAARLHRPAARRLSQPRLPLGRRAGAARRRSAAPSTPSSRSSGARRVRRSSAAAAASVPSTSPRRARRWRTPGPAARAPSSCRPTSATPATATPAGRRSGPTRAAGRCSRSTFPDIQVEPGVFVPTQGSFLIWKYLFREGVGAHQRCLDVGCGSGLQTVQLARNGAAHVHAIDIDGGAVDNTLTNAFRNGVADRVSAAAGRPVPVGARGALRRDRRAASTRCRSTPSSRSPPTGRSTTGAAT